MRKNNLLRAIKDAMTAPLAAEKKCKRIGRKKHVFQKRKKEPTWMQLCWFCKKATNGGCSWSKSFQPVEGWEGKETSVSIGEGNYAKSYEIRECPEFEAIDYPNIEKYIARRDKPGGSPV